MSKHSSWNRTTNLDRAYRGRGRCCHQPFNLPDYRVISTSIAAGLRQVIIETTHPPGAAGPVEVLWSKYRWYCEGPAYDRLSRSLNPRRYRAVAGPRAGCGSIPWTRSSAPA
ncbi:hypothetical protein [Paenarthrobacter ureafaciens]|uniref:hypothetical protein n=1 Tax=Paenarthrobacter ureafaciens TaxID=37931 RepID=UPI00226F9A34|nr:hypothetical protein [Paenarthrobacter ureafaciens]